MSATAPDRHGGVAMLRTVPLLARLPVADLQRLAQRLQPVTLQAGDTLIEQGSAADALFILTDGALDVSTRVGADEVPLARHRPGAFVGEMALLGSAPRNATVRAVRDSTLLRMEAAEFRSLLSARPAIALRVLRAAGRRLAATETTLLRRESLAALGTLAAGLAHELNNPAAAVTASAERLRTRTTQLEQRALRLGTRGLLARALAALAAHTEPYGADRTAESELRIVQSLRRSGVPGAASAAHALAACGWTDRSLTDLVAGLPQEDACLLVEWLEVHCDVTAMLSELSAAADSISAVVAAMRAHVQRDAPASEQVDVRQTVAAALLVLRPRWKARLDVRVDAPSTLPAVRGNDGALTQVWTNLVANAIDAGAGRIRVRLRSASGRVIVAVRDDGPGITPAVRRHVFEPFFTTRAADGGSGLGLHIVHSIVVQGHGGSVEVRSRPGRTTFRVTLPALPTPRSTDSEGGRST